MQLNRVVKMLKKTLLARVLCMCLLFALLLTVIASQENEPHPFVPFNKLPDDVKSILIEHATTLSIIESTAIIGTEEDDCYLKAVNLKAMLKDAEGNPLHGKSIIWYATLGTFEPSVERVTHAFGEALIIYKPPRVDTETLVTITARFTGDEKYEGSSVAIERILFPHLTPVGPPPEPPK